MRFKELFTVPAGEKVTEKAFGRVLFSSVCSILLCMACLISTTWAWFAVSIENKENWIQIGTPEVKLTLDGQMLTTGTQLSAGEHRVSIEHANEPDGLRQKGVLYVTLTLDETTCAYTVLGGQNPFKTEITVTAEKPCGFSWTVSWLEPVNARLLTGDTVEITEEAPTQPTEETTLWPTAEATDAGQTTAPATTEPGTMRWSFQAF